jgi:molybdate transport system substrate-binding protein
MLRLVSAGAAQGLVAALGAKHAIEVDATFGAVGAMLEKFLAGEPCDVLILTRAQIEDLARAKRVRADTVGDLGTVATSIAVRAADPAPFISDAAALRSTLSGADAIYFPDPVKSTAGIHFAGVLERLGLSEALAERIKTFPNGATAMRAMARASGRPIGCTQATEILATPGVRLVAPLPQGFALETTYTAGDHGERGAGRRRAPLRGDPFGRVLPPGALGRRVPGLTHSRFTRASMICARRAVSRPGNSGSENARKIGAIRSEPSRKCRRLRDPSRSSSRIVSSGNHANPRPIATARIDVALVGHRPAQLHAGHLAVALGARIANEDAAITPQIAIGERPAEPMQRMPGMGDGDEAQRHQLPAHDTRLATSDGEIRASFAEHLPGAGEDRLVDLDPGLGALEGELLEAFEEEPRREEDFHRKPDLGLPVLRHHRRAALEGGGLLEQRARAPLQHLPRLGDHGLAAADLEDPHVEKRRDLLHCVGDRRLALVHRRRGLRVAAGLDDRLQGAPLLEGDAGGCGHDLSIR